MFDFEAYNQSYHELNEAAEELQQITQLYFKPPSPPRSPYYRQRSDSVAPEPSGYWPQQPSRFAQRSMSLPMVMMPAFEPKEFKFMQAQYQPPAVPRDNGDTILYCTHPGCSRSFTRIQNLRSHARCHLENAPHVCASCGLGFRRTTDLQRHIRTVHTPNDQKPWPCPNCDKRFGRSDALKRHLASKSKEHGCSRSLHAI